ncbi:hypothetical protein L596_030756 [Steinernema carpocapsae]|uniref:Uncharacterized protein n=1 Tax=Steinernema carpocapsae TaxID=34508 RepID=A0A4U5LNN7_STECR|nr:hypothetical protein L596_030756 [Steinernema carpocapsae]
MTSFKSTTAAVLIFAFLAIVFHASEAQFYYHHTMLGAYPALRPAYYAPAYYRTPYLYPNYAYVIGSNKGAKGLLDGPKNDMQSSESSLTNNQ